MRTFKEYLAEVKDIKISKNDEFFKNRINYNCGNKWDPEKHPENKHISTSSSGHHIYKTKIRGKPGVYRYHAYAPKTKRSTISVEGKEQNGVLSHLNLASHSSNKLKAHDFYHHLLKHHLTALVADQQSPGGKAVWEKLSKKRDINIHGWSNGKPINVKFGEDETHSGNSDNDEASTEIRRMKLVAHIN